MKELFNNGVLTKDKLIALLKEAKQDENGHWYLEQPKDDLDIKLGTGGQRVYFGMFYTVCDDFIEQFTDHQENSNKNTEHYNRHFWNDDTFELIVAKDKVVEENKDEQKTT